MIIIYSIIINDQKSITCSSLLLYHLNLSTNTLTLSCVPFFNAYCTNIFAIYLVLFKFLIISTACWSWHTSHNPSLAIIKNCVLFSIGNVYISGIFDTPYKYIDYRYLLMFLMLDLLMHVLLLIVQLLCLLRLDHLIFWYVIVSLYWLFYDRLRHVLRCYFNIIQHECHLN